MENIAMNTNRRVISELNEVIFLESIGNSTRKYCYNGREFLVEDNINQVQAKLPREKFIRINDSFIINADYLKRIKSKGIKNAVLHGGIELNIAQDKYWELLKFLKFKYSIW